MKKISDSTDTNAQNPSNSPEVILASSALERTAISLSCGQIDLEIFAKDLPTKKEILAYDDSEMDREKMSAKDHLLDFFSLEPERIEPVRTIVKQIIALRGPNVPILSLKPDILIQEEQIRRQLSELVRIAQGSESGYSKASDKMEMITTVDFLLYEAVARPFLSHLRETNPSEYILLAKEAFEIQEDGTYKFLDELILEKLLDELVIFVRPIKNQD